MGESVVASPCVLKCRLDRCGLCTGCYRTLREIGRWPQMTNAEKRQVLKAIETRKAYLEPQSSPPIHPAPAAG